MHKLGIGVIGVGRMGRRHAENLRSLVPDARLAAVTDVDLKAARRLAEELEVPYCEGVNALLERSDVDAVVVASPPRFHLSAVQAAAAAGRHILCEKPLALTLEEVDTAVRAASDAKVVL